MRGRKKFKVVSGTQTQSLGGMIEICQFYGISK